jgi:MFS family permease
MLVVLVLAARLDLASGPVTEERGVLRELLAVPAMRAALATSVAFYLTVGMFEAVWAVLLHDRGAATWLIGLTLSLFSVPMIFLAPIGGRTAQRRGPLRVVTVSLSVATLCTFSYGVLPGLWLILAVSAVHATADSFTMPGNQVAAAMAGTTERASAAQGLLGATGLATAGLAGVVAGSLYQAGGRFAVCTTTAALMCVFIVAARALAAQRPGVRATAAVASPAATAAARD